MAPPVVSSVSPNQGPTSGGTTVTVTGSGFTGVTNVRFGAKPATSYTVNSSTQITAVTPSGVGSVNVTVSTTQGTSGQVVLFTYVTTPSLSSLSPNQGPVAGGTTVTLTGANLSGATAVQFGGVAATSFTVNSSTQITAVTPAHAAGAAAVTVTTPGGTSNAADPNAFFFYSAQPLLTFLAPPSGPTAGGTAVTLTGSGLLAATAVQFGGVAATSFTVDSSTQITAVAPAHAAGAAAVTVTTPGGTSNPVYYVYLNAPALVSLVPDLGPTDTGTVVTLTGNDLTTATAVQFGALSASFTVVSPTQITAVVPTGPPGPVSVTVTTPAGTSNGLMYTRFAAPSI
ncbi:IPT/TIG domain-containing protein [Streptomyces sp. 11x1]|uniref:IPT/TIG domain-containing protein n=1 Tax=Streptomyces sp. 11x1 TaxID=3038642 RepID=UPI00293077E8|nr:IPT/TIG domain-containing protein [Streptomyces sp. 11x1]WNZ08660.1 IPT/TIG domain-containing protein [Streptomyces sp. 11x1]